MRALRCLRVCFFWLGCCVFVGRFWFWVFECKGRICISAVEQLVLLSSLVCVVNKGG